MERWVYEGRIDAGVIPWEGTWLTLEGAGEDAEFDDLFDVIYDGFKPSGRKVFRVTIEQIGDVKLDDDCNEIVTMWEARDEK